VQRSNRSSKNRRRDQTATGTIKESRAWRQGQWRGRARKRRLRRRDMGRERRPKRPPLLPLRPQRKGKGRETMPLAWREACL